MDIPLPDSRIVTLGESSDPDDRSLVEAWVRSRSSESFRAIYRRHTPHLYRLAVGLLGGNRDIAQDAVQESWIRASRQLGKFGWRSSLRTWLCGIVVNCCRETRRSLAPSLINEVTESHLDTQAQPPTKLTIETIDLLRAIDSLPDGAREVLVLHGIFGHTHGEIASILGVAPGTSKSQLNYARERLRERLNITKETDND